MRQFAGSRAAVCGCALSLVLVVAAPATAATKLTGQVVGATYVASATTSAIPVLLSKESARRGHLRSQIGVLVVPRRRAVPTAGQAVLPTALRVGDRFVAGARITSAVRRAGYVRLPVTGLRITQRSTQLSLTELSALVDQTRADLAALSARVDALAASTRASLDALDARVAALAADLEGVRADVAGLHGQLGALSAQLASSAATLQARIDQVRADLQPQIGAVVGQVAALADALGSCADPASVVGRLCTLESATAAVDPATVTALTDRVTRVSGALDGVVGALTGIAVSGDLPPALTGPVTSALAQLGGLQATVAGVSGTVTSLSGTVGGLQTTVGGIQTTVAGLQTSVGGLQTSVGGLTGQVGAVDVPALATIVSNLVAALGADPSGLSPAALTALQGQVASLASAVSGVQGQLGAVNVAALNTTVGTVQGQVAVLQATMASVCSAVNGQALPVIGTLPIVGSVSGQLTAQLTDACP
jgi:hypothetical protein